MSKAVALSQKPKSKNHKKRKVALIIGVILLLLIGFLAYLKFRPEPTYPLGNKLEYIGKDDYGCWVCDSTPASNYFYATDMTTDEIIKYFDKTTVERQPSTLNNETYFGLKTSSGETAYLYYYDKKEHALPQHNSFKTSSKSHILKVPSFKYRLLKESM